MTLTLAATIVVLAVVYWASIKIHPLTTCRWCNGSKRNHGSTRKRFGHCSHCGGTGAKLRLGARIFRRL